MNKHMKRCVETIVIITILIVGFCSCNNNKLDAVYKLYRIAAEEANTAVGITMDQEKETIVSDTLPTGSYTSIGLNHIEIDNSSKNAIEIWSKSEWEMVNETYSTHWKSNSYYKDGYYYLESDLNDLIEKYKLAIPNEAVGKIFNFDKIFVFPKDSIQEVKLVEDDALYMITFYINGDTAYSYFQSADIDQSSSFVNNAENETNADDAVVTAILDKKSKQLIETKITWMVTSSYADRTMTIATNVRIFNINLGYVEIEFPNDLSSYLE